MKSITGAKKKIVVALLGMCVVASTYSTAHAVQPPPNSATTGVQAGGGTPQDVWFGFYPWYYYYYYYYPVFYYYPIFYYYPYYYYYVGFGFP